MDIIGTIFMDLNKFDTKEEWVEAVVSYIRGLEPQVVGLAGGSTPQPVYERLNLDAKYYSIDERVDGSNAAMINEAMPDADVVFWDVSGTREEALEKMRSELEDFDLLILGMGSDGHVASLFPGGPELESEDLVVTSETDQFEVQKRLSLGYNGMMTSRNAVLLISGEDKLKVIEDMGPQYPIHRILTNIPTKIFYYG